LDGNPRQGLFAMKLEIPEPLAIENEELHAELADAARAGGAVGEAALAVARVLHSHFQREARFAMPPLSLLRPLAAGHWEPAMVAEVLAVTDALKKEMPRLLEEHKSIVAALKVLGAVAGKENRTEYAWLAQKLILHARTEEEVLYPAALLVGEYLRLRQRADAP
jgi:hypothetical protein